MSLGHMPPESQFGWWMGMLWVIAWMAVMVHFKPQLSDLQSIGLALAVTVSWFLVFVSSSELYVKLNDGERGQKA